MTTTEYPVPSAEKDPRSEFPHYHKDVSHLEYIDVYRVCDLFGVTDSAIAHAVKKLLVAGCRGTKGKRQDIAEAIKSLLRQQQMWEEDVTPKNPFDKRE